MTWKFWSYFKIFIIEISDVATCHSMWICWTSQNYKTQIVRAFSRLSKESRASMLSRCYFTNFVTEKSSFRSEFRASSSSIHRKEVFERRVIGRIAEGRVFQAGIFTHGTIYCESLCSISSTRFLRLLRSRASPILLSHDGGKGGIR